MSKPNREVSKGGIKEGFAVVQPTDKFPSVSPADLYHGKRKVLNNAEECFDYGKRARQIKK